MPLEDETAKQRIAAVRQFSRFYTRTIGALGEGLLDSPFSLAEARVLYELDQRGSTTATDLSRELGIDAGYLSRILQGFERGGLIAREVSVADRRQNLVAISAKGRTAFAPLAARSCEQVSTLLDALSEPAQTALVAAMAQIEALLEPGRAAPWLLRQHRPGDIGWVISRHGALYAREYGFDARFEALVAEIASSFLASHDPARERCWIAERDGVNVGSVFLVKESDELARLRMLIVEPAARGLGVGQRLVGECIACARESGYRRIVLSTHDVLVAARNIYRACGFRMVSSMPHNDFGPSIVSEDWELPLH